MDLAQLIEALSDPAAYPDPVGEVEVRQTHISAVFLAGPYVYKVKKPVEFGFLDFSTLAKRRHYCEEEVRLNRRLAPEVYLGVVPVTRDARGVRVEGDGEVVEWAVKMRRLPDEATLQKPPPAGRGRASRWWRPWRARSPPSTRRPSRARGSPPSGASRWWPATPGRTSSSPRPTSAPPSARPSSRERGHSPRRPWPATAP